MSSKQEDESQGSMERNLPLAISKACLRLSFLLYNHYYRNERFETVLHGGPGKMLSEVNSQCLSKPLPIFFVYVWKRALGTLLIMEELLE